MSTFEKKIMGDSEQKCRDTLEYNLDRCTEQEQALFKRMYSHNNPDLHEVILNMPVGLLRHALEQVEATLKKKDLKMAII